LAHSFRSVLDQFAFGERCRGQPLTKRELIKASRLWTVAAFVHRSWPGPSNPAPARHGEWVTVPDWLDDVVPLLDPTALPRVLTLAEAEARGYPFPVVRRRVRRRRWVRLAPGIYCTDSSPDRLDHLEAAVKHGGPAAVLSGSAALWQCGFRAVGSPKSALVLVPLGCGARSTGSISIRRTGRLPEPAPRPGPAVAPVQRAVLDHVRSLTDLDEVRAVVAEAVQREFCDPGQLVEELAGSARNGSSLARQAIADIAAGARSAPEARAARLLRGAGLSGFEQNVTITVAGRAWRPDFLWRALLAILEIDSYEHHFRRADWQATLRRHLILESAGYSVVHVPPSALHDGPAFVGHVREWLAARRRQLNGP
jgi:very-short-patch-repair endonuclease